MVADRGQWQAELDANNAHRNRDRRAQVITSLLTALGAIVAAYSAARVGLDKLEAGSAPYSISTIKAANGPDEALKVDAKTGETWVLVSGKAGQVWQKLP